jgi:hypothetical protein
MLFHINFPNPGGYRKIGKAHASSILDSTAWDINASAEHDYKKKLVGG